MVVRVTLFDGVDGLPRLVGSGVTVYVTVAHVEVLDKVLGETGLV